MRFQIAPNFYDDDWDKLKLKLPNNGDWHRAPTEWREAIRVFKQRIKTRFLEPAAALERGGYAGFAILALDCLLIETIGAFKNGKNARNTGESKKVFVNFLTGSPSFSAVFNAARAEDFFTYVRNGLLHDGETRKGWLVKKRGVHYPMVDFQSGGFVIVDREKFHKALVNEFDSYTRSLEDPMQNGLRQNLLTALNDLIKRSRP
ncbi:MAG: hypothetical protein HYS38_09210 [Acidobacteria bacterium]|nr:hypothetical protein [Acidobacteriota bacterium]